MTMFEDGYGSTVYTEIDKLNERYDNELKKAKTDSQRRDIAIRRSRELSDLVRKYK